MGIRKLLSRQWLGEFNSSPVIWLSLALLLCCSLVACSSTGGGKKKADEISPENAHIELAMNFIQQGDFDSAEQQLLYSARLNRANAELDNAYGIFHQQTGDLDRADRRFNFAISKQPNNPRFNNNYGVLLSNSGRKREALKYLEIAYSDDEYSNRASAYENYGDIMYELGDYDEALEHYENALRFNPGWFILNNKIALAHYSRGTFGDAYAFFEEYIKRVRELSILPSDQDIELGLAIAAAVKDFQKVEEYQELVRQRTLNKINN